MHNLPRTSVSLLLSVVLVLSSLPVTALAEPEEPEGAGSDVILVEEVSDGSGDLAGDEGEPEGGDAAGTTIDGTTDGQDNSGTTTDEGVDVLEGDPSDAAEDVSDDEALGDADEESAVEAETDETTAIEEPQQEEAVPEAEEDKEVSTQSNKPTVKAANVSLSVQAHVQNIGWKDPVGSGKLAGTTGKALRVEALRISLDGNGSKLPSGSIEYRAHVQNVGWQDWKANGKLAGTTNRSLRIEALQIRLTGELADLYDVYYQVHVQNIGWMAVAKNGEATGSAGRSYRVEALRVWLVKKGGAAPSPATDTSKVFRGVVGLKAQAHVQNVGWMAAVGSGSTAGTTGRGQRLEALQLRTEGLDADGSIVYRAHVQNVGWQGWRKDGQTAGTTGRGLRIEALQAKLKGELAEQYDLYYRVHVSEVGWLGWAKNGESAGSEGMSARIEAVQFRLQAKGSKAPTSSDSQPYAFIGTASLQTAAHIKDGNWRGWVASGKTAGTTGKSLAIDGLRVKVDTGEWGVDGGIRYSVCYEKSNWQGWQSDGAVAGNDHPGERIEAVKVELTGDLSSAYSVWYRVHLSNAGWIGWARDGQIAGTTTAKSGMTVEAVQVKLVPKPSPAPASNSGYFKMHIPVTSDAWLDDFVWSTIDRNGWSGMSGLRSAYNYVRSFNYRGGSHWPGPNYKNWVTPFAREMARNHGGNCYRFAALMYMFGKALGFDISCCAGQFQGVNTGDHGWCEVRYNGTTYIVDAEMGCASAWPNYDWCMIRYKDARIKYFDLNGRRILK